MTPAQARVIHVTLALVRHLLILLIAEILYQVWCYRQERNPS